MENMEYKESKEILEKENQEIKEVEETINAQSNETTKSTQSTESNQSTQSTQSNQSTQSYQSTSTNSNPMFPAGSNINEEYAIVLDYMPTGKPGDFKNEAVAQVIGTNNFTLLEVAPKEKLNVTEKVFVGKGDRDKIEFIKRRIAYSELTSTASSELEKAIETIIDENEKKFVDFYNNSKSITLRRHQIELLPGLGKKHMLDIINQREKKKFETFQEMEEKVKLLPNPKKAIIKRIIEELEGHDVKYYIFVRPPNATRNKFENRDSRFPRERRFNNYEGNYGRNQYNSGFRRNY